METSKKLFYGGTSGLVLPWANKQSYPPELQDKSRLTAYASLFNSIEINSSFYKIPMSATVAKWAESVPDEFRFTFKLWRDITHAKGLVFSQEDVARFMETIGHVDHKKGSLLVQFPPGLKVKAAFQLEKLLTHILESDPEREWKIAIEFRNTSWYEEDIYALADEYEVAIVRQDMPASATPYFGSDAGYVYLRFHGPEGSYRGTYSNDFLHEHAQYIRECNEDGKVVFVYFNNTVGAAVKNLMTLNTFVSELVEDAAD